MPLPIAFAIMVVEIEEEFANLFSVFLERDCNKK
jgi:hypothetical protein